MTQRGVDYLLTPIKPAVSIDCAALGNGNSYSSTMSAPVWLSDFKNPMQKYLALFSDVLKVLNNKRLIVSRGKFL